MFQRCLPVMIVMALVSPLSAGETEKFFSERSKDFGTVPFGAAQVHQFKITNTSKQVVRIASARVSCGCTTASIPVNTLNPGDSTYLTASMDTKRFVGHKEVIIYVTFANPAEEVTLSVKANRNDNFSKTAELITMAQARKGGVSAGSMQVTMRNDPNFTLNASTNTDFVVATAKLLKRERFEVVYEVHRNLRDPRRKLRLRGQLQHSRHGRDRGSDHRDAGPGAVSLRQGRGQQGTRRGREGRQAVQDR